MQGRTPPRADPRDAPFRWAVLASLGAAAAVALLLAAAAAGQALVLVLLAGFLAVGLDPAVGALCRRGWRRRLAVATVLLALLAVLVGFVVLAVPALTQEYRSLSQVLRGLIVDAQTRSDLIGQQARRLRLDPQQPVTAVLSPNVLLGAARAALGLASSAVVVFALTAYLLADLPAVKQRALQLVPRHRRPRVGLLGEEILRRVGGFLLGNLLTSAAAGLSLYPVLLVLGVPGAAFLALLVALFDLVPVVGAPVAGAVATLAALSVSLPAAAITAVFLLLFRLLEDYLLAPRIMARTVEVSPALTLCAVLLFGALLGIVGGLLAVPVAAAADLLRREVLEPRQDAC